jgi:hypothetical protein
MLKLSCIGVDSPILILSNGKMRNLCRFDQYSASGHSKYCDPLKTDVDPTVVC